MPKILYCEDDKFLREDIVGLLKMEFEEYAIVSSGSAREALTELTQVDLSQIRGVSVDSITRALLEARADFSDLRLVITDGQLIDRYAGADDNIIDGWDLAQILRNVGYQGCIIYNGGSNIPAGCEHLFDQVMDKLFSSCDDLIDYARTQLE